MGKRGRARGVTPAKEPAALHRPRVSNLDPLRRTMTAYLFGALLLGVVTLAGIIVLGGSLGPFITLAVVVLAAGLIHRAARQRLAGATLTNEDRMMQTLAGGMLVICVVLAAAGAVVASIA